MLFGNYGKIEYVNIAYDSQGNCKHFAFVKFSSKEVLSSKILYYFNYIYIYSYQNNIIII